MENEINKLIHEAEFVLIGLGEEFEQYKPINEKKKEMTCNCQEKANTEAEILDKEKEFLKQNNMAWIKPIVKTEIWKTEYNRNKLAVSNLAEFIYHKNYFVVSLCTNDITQNEIFDKTRVVSPCGNLGLKQCTKGCECNLIHLSPENLENVRNYTKHHDYKQIEIGKCEKCGMPYSINNIYNNEYDEAGYLNQWSIYMNWIQNTMNKKLVVLELGVGMNLPQVIRWPFEKAVFYNKKASLIRVNDKFYHMTEELKNQGYAIKKNAVDWLQNLQSESE